MQQRPARSLIVILTIAIIYFAAARLGLSLAFEAQQVSVVWPPTGLAIFAVLFFGLWVWPGIMLGAFAANYSVAPQLIPALTISLGNTLEAVTAYWLLRCVFDFNQTFCRVRDGLLLLGCGVVSTAVAASIGALTLCASGLEQWASLGKLWGWWWLGDSVGCIVLTPLLLSAAQSLNDGSHQRRQSIGELGALLLLLAIAGMVLFSNLGTGSAHHPLEYIFFPFVVWSAFRFGQLETSLVTTLCAAIAIEGTLNGSGPFAGPYVQEGLVQLQSYVAILASTGLLLNAAITEGAAEHRGRLEVAQRAEQKKDEFIAMLAHELRNPLAPVRNALHLLKGLAAKPQEVLRLQAIMERQIGHMVRIVDDLLDLSRVTWDALTIKQDRITVASVMETALESSLPTLEAGGIRCEMKKPAVEIWVNGDITRLAQAISNLLSNAAKYTEKGGTVTLSAGVQDGRAKISVKDTGAGISPERLSGIFDMYMQTGRGESDKRQGLGIGLALVKRLVELHGGTVSATSDGLGKGSEFVLSLPLAASNELTGASDGATTIRPRVMSPRKILVVDDNVDLAESLADILLQEGNEVRVVHDGLSALAAAKAFEPDLIFLDIGIPEMNGYEVAKQIRTDVRLKKAVIVAQTGWGRQEDIQNALDAGFDKHLTKPFDVSSLYELLASI